MKMLLDVDTGIDDGMAIAYAVGSQDVELIGIVGSYGNIETRGGVKNALNLLNLLGEDNIPVYVGAEHALNKPAFERLAVSARIHGDNGVGNISFEHPSIQKALDNGIDFIIQSVKTYGKELTIVTTGPLTNLATALKKAPEIEKMIGKVVIMGGAITVPGNIRKIAEANISQDPEAAKYVFESSVSITMVGLDVTMRSILTKNDTMLWRQNGTVGTAYADMVDYYIDHVNAKDGCYLHDPSAIAAAIHPEWFTMLPMHVTVITEEGLRGRTICDPDRMRNCNPNVQVCLNVDSKQVLHHFNDVLNTVFNTAN